jgi:magnesium transporter
MWRALYSEPPQPPKSVPRLQDVAVPSVGSPGVLWLDLHAPAPEEIALLSEVFRLDPLVVEDCVSELHHPKVDAYEALLFLAVHGVRVGAERGEIGTLELDVILGPNYLITYRADEMPSLNEVWDRAARQGLAGAGGAPLLLQQLLASQATTHLREIERLQEDVFALERRLFDQSRRGASLDLAERLFDIKTDLARLRSIMGSQRDVVVRLSRGEFHLIPSALLMQFKDVHDDLHRATEMLDLLREVSATALDTHLMLATHRTNEIGRVLTILATFLLPLTLVTGWYGMNFRHMVGLEWPHAEFYVLGLFAAISGGLWLFLRYRRWL